MCQPEQQTPPVGFGPKGGRQPACASKTPKETKMADQDRYQNDDNRDRLGQRDVYMDNRTGIGAQHRGYRAEWGRGAGERERDRDWNRQSDREESYGQRRAESPSFRDQDYRDRDDEARYGTGGAGGYYGESGGYGRSGRWSRNEDYGQTYGRQADRDRDRYRTSNPSYSSSYGGTGRQYGRNEDWQSYGGSSNTDYGPYGRAGGNDNPDRDRSLETYRGESRWEREHQQRNHSNEGGYGSGYGDAYGSYGAAGRSMRGRSQEADYRRDREDRDRDGQRGDDQRGFWDRAADKVASWFGGEDSQGSPYDTHGGYGSDYRRGEEYRGESHRGRGPKNYRRSDDRVREDVSDRLTDDHWLDASDIEVTAKDAEVTLSGTVKSREDKRRAEQLAEQVSGVDNVQNNIRVQKQDWRSDESTGAMAGSMSGAAGSGTTGSDGGSTAHGGSSTTSTASATGGSATSGMSAEAGKSGKATQ
jgi:osmotically-inducible protein OsmY